MKALTNILNYILLLMMILIASCTEDTAEVDDLVRGEEYVTVRMQVPGMKNATTRADEAEDNLTSVWALVFRDGKLVSKTEVTTESTLIPSTSTTRTFNIPRPKSGDVIHFLGNVPNGVTLPDVDAAESALCNLETDDRENLSYWGKATYTGGDITVNLYRHLAKIEIAPDPNECTFPEDQLFIAGLVNANTKGKLVPYDDENEAFNFDLSDENYGGNYDYCTVPAEPNPLEETPLLDNNGAGFKNWLYVFEHENPETADGLYVICKIGKCYYKVALKSDGDGVKPYNIIRNHKYTILVNDLDEIVYDIPDDITEEDDIENYKYQQALASDPINLEVKEMKDVTLTITPSATSLNYDDNETSAEQVTVTVGGLQDVVETLTFTAPGYTILSDYAESAGEGVFTITDTSKTEIDFTFTLTDQSQAGEISVTGEGDFVSSINTAETSIQWNKRQEVNGEIVMWEGSVKMHVPDGDSKHAAKIPIPYSFFFDAEGNATVLAGSKVHVDYSGTGWFVAYTTKGEWQHIWNIMDDGADLVLTEELLTTLKENRNTVWNVDAAFLLQGGGPTMTKVTLIPAKESIDAEPDKTQLYYDSDDTQVVTINVTVPDGVETLNIGGASYFTIAKTAGDGKLDGTTYTMGSERTATFTFTLLNAQNVTPQQTITFSDPSETVNAASVTITMAPTPTVEFSPDEISKEMSINDTYTITMIVPNNDELTALSIDAEGFTVTASTEGLSGSDGSYTYTGGTTQFTFTLTSADTDSRTIRFYNGQGVDINVPEKEISVTVKAAAVTNMSVSPTNAIIDMDNSQTFTTLTLTKPASVQSVKVNISAENAFNITSTATSNVWAPSSTEYYFQNLSNVEEVPFTFTVRDGFDTAGEYTITYSDANNAQMSTTATITVVNTPTVSFSNTGKQTLYWNGGTNPTTFTVDMTNIPTDGSVTLSITAADFAVSVTEGTITDSDGTYTYTGGNTTFTFTPTNHGTDKSITITGSGTNVNVPEKTVIAVDVKNENASTVSLEIISPNPATTNIDLGSFNAWETEKSFTMQLRIPVGVNQVTFGGENISDFTVTYNSSALQNNVYTNNNSNSQQDVSFTFVINNNASLGEHVINITGSGDGITVNAAQLVVTITQTVFGVTPTSATISNTNKSVEVTIVKPKSLSQFSFKFSDNSMLEATGNTSNGFQCNNNIYYFYNSNNTMEEVITVKLKENVTITEEKECTITFYDNTSAAQNDNTKTVIVKLQP